MTGFDSTLSSDCYKIFHPSAGHPDLVKTYENFTNRSGKYSNVPDNTHVVNLGWQYIIKKHLKDRWDSTFFNVKKEYAVARYAVITSSILGYQVDISHIETLHDLGYLPLQIKSYPEGTLVPYGVASATFETTEDGFEWLVGMLETVISQEVWPIQTSATTSLAYLVKQRELFEKTGMDMGILPFMIHDFSARGMFGEEASAMSGFAHLAMGNLGSDTIAAGMFAEQYYGADWEEGGIMNSVNATEHSVTCGNIAAFIEELVTDGKSRGYTIDQLVHKLKLETEDYNLMAEFLYYEYLMQEVAPEGILSLVADTNDFFGVLKHVIPALKETILARDGKTVLRPDSGDPVDILCGVGATSPTITEEETKGLVETLWDIFGGTTTDKGYKVLDSHIGAIYGDAITLDRQQQIGNRLMAKGFVPQVVLGVGSFSFQHVTRDTHGSAMKATSVSKYLTGDNTDSFVKALAVYDQPIAKDPKTDPKKKSARGLLRIEREAGELVQYDNQTREQEQEGELQVIFRDGYILKEQTLQGIREVVSSQF